MSVNETLSKKVYRTLKTIDGSGNKTWNKLAFWTTADQVELENGDNAQDILESIMMRNTTVYVSTTGSDTTGTGSSSYPFKTINMALSKIPKNLNGYTATINIASGTYTENVLTVGIHGGSLVMSITGVVTINGYISASSISANISINTTTSGSLVINNTPNFAEGAIRVAACAIFGIGVPVTINSTTMGIFMVSGSSFYSGGLLAINNTTNGAVRVGANSKASIVGGLTGSNNAVGLWADASIISYATYSLTATTPFLKGNGGIITNDLVTQSQIGAKVVVSATAPSDTSAVWVY